MIDLQKKSTHSDKIKMRKGMRETLTLIEMYIGTHTKEEDIERKQRAQKKKH